MSFVQGSGCTSPFDVAANDATVDSINAGPRLRALGRDVTFRRVPR